MIGENWDIEKFNEELTDYLGNDRIPDTNYQQNPNCYYLKMPIWQQLFLGHVMRFILKTRE